MNVIAQGDREIVITRNFNAPRRLVFEAHTKPELLKRWLGVRGGWILATCEIDLRVGGRYRYVWRKESKNIDMGAGGVYREIDAPARIVCTEAFDDPWYPGESLNTTEFIEQDGVTNMTLTLRYESASARDGVLQSPMESGLGGSYAQLDALLKTTLPGDHQ
jgi:uncharacterized protein YndB with AHSA1/START domain